MIGHLAIAYLLGGITFWPLVVLLGYVSYWYVRPTLVSPPVASKELTPEHVNESKPSKIKYFNHQNLPFSQKNGKNNHPDLESDVEFSCWVRVAPTYITGSDAFDDTDSQLQTGNKQPSSNARSSLLKLMSSTGFFGSSATSTNSGPQGEGSTATSSSSVNSEYSKPKTVSKCPKYWAVVRGAQLQLFEDKSERKLLDFLMIPQFIVTIWPQNLREFELFYRRYPIALMSRTEPEGIVSLDMYPGLPPRDAVYLYLSNPVEKEDLYFQLIKDSKEVDPRSPNSAETLLSLGPRDPISMAKPIKVKKAETQRLQSCIWNNELPLDTQWLNAILGRIFLALKDSKLADDYLRYKFSAKLKPISASSNIIGDITVKQIKSGTAAPYISNIKLKELSPDGNLVLSAGVSYSGGFKVNLATTVKLAAVTSLTTVEIPVELAATLRKLEGNVIIRVKPAPSERIWYAFETMPNVDLHIEPAVYETHISLSVVTKFIKSKILDSLKESLVMPFMDDICFYDTSDCFYRGGIWETPPKEKEGSQPLKGQPGARTIAKQQSKKMSDNGMSSGAHGVFSQNLGQSAALDTALSPPITGQVRKRVPSESDSVASMTPESSVVSSTTVQRISNWVKSKRSSRDIKVPTNNSKAAEPRDIPDDSSAYLSDADSMLSMSPNSMSRRPRATTTTQVTATNAPANTGVNTGTDEFSEKVSSTGQATGHFDCKTNGTALPGSTTGTHLHMAAEDNTVDESNDIHYEPVDRFVDGTNDDNKECNEANNTPLEQFRPAPHQFRLSESGPNPEPEMEPGPIFTSSPLEQSPSLRPHAVRRKPVPVSTEELGKLEFPNLHKANPSTDISSESIKGEISEPLSRRSSFSSQRSLKSSYPTEVSGSRSIRSVRSSSSNQGPSLPPRNRRIVPLSNVPPERAS